jgi:hypothetical protein
LSETGFSVPLTAVPLEERSQRSKLRRIASTTRRSSESSYDAKVVRESREPEDHARNPSTAAGTQDDLLAFKS